MREIAENINCEKIILKQQKMILVFDTKNKINGLKNKTLNKNFIKSGNKGFQIVLFIHIRLMEWIVLAMLPMDLR